MEEQLFGTYVSWKVDSHTWFITSGNGSLYMYLVEGEDKALLIDTAYGFGNLRAYVESLTDKPVMVANTHGHLDHVGGNGWWPEVYMHPQSGIDMATLEHGPFDVSALPYPDYRQIYITEGDRLDLGGRSLEVIEFGAHSASTIALLDSEGYLFCGDELESAQVLFLNHSERMPVAQHAALHLAAMQKLAARMDDIRFICPAHNGAPIAKDYVRDFIELDRQLIAGTQTASEKLEHFFIEKDPQAHQMRRARYGGASFIYRV